MAERSCTALFGKRGPIADYEIESGAGFGRLEASARTAWPTGGASYRCAER
jgi:hypothetical protein